jgi:catechol 2,3-dioxygenase-like lactoylglutathione lyase family enzyme
MPTVSKIVESALDVDDLGRSIAFYEGLFGFVKMVGNDRFCAFAVPGDQVLLLFLRGASQQPFDFQDGRIPPHDTRGVQHMAFAIAPEELEPWSERLAERGVAIESRVTWGLGGQSLYFRDPDNHLLELITPGCWPNY